MDRTLLYDFWSCGDDQIIKFAIYRAHLNRHERDVIHLMLDECLTQEKVAEELHYSTRMVQNYWYSASDKLLAIPWLIAYAKSLRH